jgi:hypothetical protein
MEVSKGQSFKMFSLTIAGVYVDDRYKNFAWVGNSGKVSSLASLV